MINHATRTLSLLISSLSCYQQLIYEHIFNNVYSHMDIAVLSKWNKKIQFVPQCVTTRMFSNITYQCITSYYKPVDIINRFAFGNTFIFQGYWSTNMKKTRKFVTACMHLHWLTCFRCFFSLFNTKTATILKNYFTVICISLKGS